VSLTRWTPSFDGVTKKEGWKKEDGKKKGGWMDKRKE
jgi:hypothetical protein